MDFSFVRAIHGYYVHRDYLVCGFGLYVEYLLCCDPLPSFSCFLLHLCACLQHVEKKEPSPPYNPVTANGYDVQSLMVFHQFGSRCYFLTVVTSTFYSDGRSFFERGGLLLEKPF